jgi:hypothetical protein
VARRGGGRRPRPTHIKNAICYATKKNVLSLARSNHQFSGATAQIHFVFEAFNRQSRIVPCNAVRSAAFLTPEQFLSYKGMNVMDCIYFAYRRRSNSRRAPSICLPSAR